MTPVARPAAALAEDPALAFAADALDTEAAAGALSRALRDASRDESLTVTVERAALVRHKPARRCLVEYALVLRDATGRTSRLEALGKVRAKGLDAATPRLHAELVAAGFGPGSADGISVPEPLGTIPEWKMWLQRKERGAPLTALLQGTDGPRLARRAAEALRKLHAAPVAAQRRHTAADELRILEGALGALRAARPDLSPRVAALLAESARLAEELPDPGEHGIHRDFHPDQALVHGDRIVLLDLDLFASGDPAVDAGNFLAHVTELSLRRAGSPAALDAVREAHREAFLAGRDDGLERRVLVYDLLSLARLVALSPRYPDRIATTDALLTHCEESFRKASR